MPLELDYEHDVSADCDCVRPHFMTEKQAMKELKEMGGVEEICTYAHHPKTHMHQVFVVKWPNGKYTFGPDRVCAVQAYLDLDQYANLDKGDCVQKLSIPPHVPRQAYGTTFIYFCTKCHVNHFTDFYHG